MTYRTQLSVLFLSVTLCAAQAALAQPDPVPSRWQPYQVKFRFSGFHTYYTCDGIRSTMKRLLEGLGARDDIRIESACYRSMGEVQEFHNLNIAFALPVPAESGDDPEEIFPARWQEVRYRKNHPRHLDGGDCELVEQFVDQVLGEVNVRDLEYRSSCSPYGTLINVPRIRMTVLLPLEQEAAAADAGPPQPE